MPKSLVVLVAVAVAAVASAALGEEPLMRRKQPQPPSSSAFAVAVEQVHADGHYPSDVQLILEGERRWAYKGTPVNEPAEPELPAWLREVLRAVQGGGSRGLTVAATLLAWALVVGLAASVFWLVRGGLQLRKQPTAKAANCESCQPTFLAAESSSCESQQPRKQQPRKQPTDFLAATQQNKTWADNRA